MFFIWQEDENEEHIAKHGIETHEVEYVVRNAKRPYPRRASEAKWLVRGAPSEDGSSRSFMSCAAREK
jgi:uncharacterized DUF497 family protein